jgi:bacterioferritin
MARKEDEESIGEVRHADLLMERLFTLEALPNPQHLGKQQIGQTLVEALGCDLASEKVARAALNDGMAPTGLSRDHVSQDIFNHVLEDSEVHIDCLEIRFERVGNVGEQNCLRSQMGS